MSSSTSSSSSSSTWSSSDSHPSLNDIVCGLLPNDTLIAYIKEFFPTKLEERKNIWARFHNFGRIKDETLRVLEDRKKDLEDLENKSRLASIDAKDQYAKEIKDCKGQVSEANYTLAMMDFNRYEAVLEIANLEKEVYEHGKRSILEASKVASLLMGYSEHYQAINSIRQGYFYVNNKGYDFEKRIKQLKELVQKKADAAEKLKPENQATDVASTWKTD